MLMSNSSHGRHNYISEDSLFHQDPCKFLRDYFPDQIDPNFPATSESGTSKHAWPSHLAVFDYILSFRCNDGNETLDQILHTFGYVQEKRFWNTFWHEDPRRAGDVIIFKHSSLSATG